jgi:hypothetical protein
MPQEEEKLQEVGTIYETKTPQETRTPAAEAARTQQLRQKVSLELWRKRKRKMWRKMWRKMRLEMSRKQPN